MPLEDIREIKTLAGQAISTLRIMAVMVGGLSDEEIKQITTKQEAVLSAIKGVSGLLLAWPDILMDVLRIFSPDDIMLKIAGEKLEKLKKTDGEVVKHKLRRLAIDPLKTSYDVLRARFADHPFMGNYDNELESKVQSIQHKELSLIESVTLHRRYLGDTIARILLYVTSKDPTKPNESAREAFNFIMKEVGA